MMMVCTHIDETMTLNDVFILEVKTMRWTAPSIDGVPPKPRTYHQGRTERTKKLSVAMELTQPSNSFINR